jgi:hypothetical protein
MWGERRILESHIEHGATFSLDNSEPRTRASGLVIRESSPRNANLELHFGPRKNEGIAEPPRALKPCLCVRSAVPCLCDYSTTKVAAMTYGNIVGWCGIFGFVMALLAVPSAIAGIFQLKNRLIPQGQELLAAVTKSEFSEFKVEPDEERIVMQFDPRRISEPGTFEHEVWKFKNACPKGSYHNSFLLDPRSVINLAESRLESSLILVVGMALFVAALGILAQFGTQLFPTGTSKTVNAPVGFVYVVIGFIMFISVIVVFFRIMVYGPWKARAASIDYVTYLAKNNIRIGFEFTKLRRAAPWLDARGRQSPW